MIQDERDEQIKRAIRSLTPEQARIVLLRFFQDSRKPESFKQIGKIVGKTPGAAEKAYLRAKQLLKKYLERGE